MFPFLFIAIGIIVIGPGQIEGGFDAVRAKGLKPALEKAWEERKTDNLSGNFGNP